MSIVNTSITKQPLKMIEVPLHKFKDEVIPHHQKIFDEYKPHILKLMTQDNNAKLVQQETQNKKRVVRQLKDLMYELDTLRTQVEDEDLDVFDAKTVSLRKIILNLVTGYSDLEKRAALVVHKNEAEEAPDPFADSPHIQIHASIADIKLTQQQQVLDEVENIQKDTEDLHEMYETLHGMVGAQRAPVEHIAESVESTNTNVDSGLKQLIKAHKLKTATYPLAGAFLGGIVGGPIGMVAGLKVGGIAALGCAIVGYTGGRFFKKTHEVAKESSESETNLNESDSSDKKDI